MLKYFIIVVKNNRQKVVVVFCSVFFFQETRHNFRMYASDLDNDDGGEILLVGEANFSFSLSLCKYISPSRLTTTCYETRQRLESIHGSDLIKSNVNQLERLLVKSIRFGVDATRLEVEFPCRKFQRIYFMFPHVSGRSNLRKNRQLMFDFFQSSRQVLSETGSVIIGLAAGQGGTSFECDPAKRLNKDSWTISQLGQQNGFILTSCDIFQADLFDCYKSTGFRSQSKSFSVLGSLVHTFQLSLPVEDYSLIDHFWRVNSFLSRHKHPFRSLRDFLARFLASDTNIIEDTIDLCSNLK